MSFVSPETIQAIAHSINITKLAPEAAKALGPDVEYRLRELVQDAQKFARHSKRSTLTTTDVNNALRTRNAEPLYGFGSKDPAKYIKAVGQPDVYCIQDRELPVEQVIDGALPRVPVEVGVMPHWLIINGVQPATPENAPLSKPMAKKQKQKGELGKGLGATGARGGAAGTCTAANGDSTGAGPSGVQVQPPVQHILSRELQLYFTKVTDIIKAAAAAAAADGGVGAAAAGVPLWGAASDAKAGTSGGASSSAAAEQERHLRAVLASLSTDSGLHPLLPYFIKFLSDEVTAGLRGPPAALHVLLRLADALLRNEHFGMEHYCHQLLPVLLTCCVAKGIGGSGTADHWPVRDRSAKLVGQVCARFGDPFYNVTPRVSKTLLRALLDTGKPLATHYGAIKGLASLGHASVRLLLLPQLEPYMCRLQPLLQGSAGAAAGGDTAMGEVTGGGHTQGAGNGDAANLDKGVRGSRGDAWRVYDALVDAIGAAMYARVVEAAASAVPDQLLAAARPKLSLLPALVSGTKGGSSSQADTKPDSNGHGDAMDVDASRKGAAGNQGPGSRSPGEVLAEGWREDADLGELLWACGEVLGEAFSARMPQSRPPLASI